MKNPFIFMIMIFTLISSQTRVSMGSIPSSFTYHQIFSVNDIPPPENNSEVRGIYSPHVVKVDNKFVMFFGISVYCQQDTVARDSIGYAESPDGINNWKFIDYIIEPDPRACRLAPKDWPDDMIFQVNDPSVVYQNDSFYITYTAAKYDRSLGHIKDCGMIGTTILNSNYEVVYRNDFYLEATGANCGNGGFSRPAYRQIGPGSYELWFDQAGTIYYIPVTSVNSLNENNIVYANMTGTLDIDVFNIGPDEKMMLANNPLGIYYTTSMADNIWHPWQPMTYLSGQVSRWDKSGQGSPYFFVDPDNGTSQIYLGGVVLADCGGYETINIGVAIPRNGALGKQVHELRRYW